MHQVDDSKQPSLLDQFFAFWSRRPFSVIAALAGAAMIAVSVIQIQQGQNYFAPLNDIDQTTLIMIGILILRIVIVLRHDRDLQAASLALIGTLACVYTFEAVYKWAFYLLPWQIPPAELRELVIQIGIALTGLVGFAFGRFQWTRPTRIFTALFVLGWAFWILVGFPQIFDARLYTPEVIHLPLSHDAVYILNRVIKALIFLALFFAVRSPHQPAESPAARAEA